MARQLLRVLVADDDESVRILLQRFLEGAGYVVETANDGQQAVSKAQQSIFDVALLDISMPGMSGIEVLRWLTDNKPEVCSLMVTAIADVDTAVQAMKLGAYDYITKPFEKEDTLHKIRNALLLKRTEIEENKHMVNLEKKVVEQTMQLQQQFNELVETLAREHSLLYQVAQRQKGGSRQLFKRLPPELQEPMSSVEEFSEALLRILRRHTSGAQGNSSVNNKD